MNTEMCTFIHINIMKRAVWTVARPNLWHLHNRASGQVEMPVLFILVGWNWVMFGNHWSLTARVGAFNVTAALPPSLGHSCHYWKENIYSTPPHLQGLISQTACFGKWLYSDWGWLVSKGLFAPMKWSKATLEMEKNYNNPFVLLSF